MADNISITICGDGGCGKSSITLRLVRSQWTHEYDPTIVDGLPYFLSLTDTAGQEEYRGLWAASNLKSDAFLLVYDITNGPSLEALDYFMEMIEIEAEQRLEDNQRLLRELGSSAEGVEVGMPPPVKIIAGNKCDLKDARVITARQGLEYARRHGCGFMETSAREMVNIEETFALIVRRVVEARRLHYQQQQPQKLQGKQLQSPEKMGNSTARTPALTATEKEASDEHYKDGRRRHSRFLGMSKAVLKRVGKRRPSGGTETRGDEHMKEKSRRDPGHGGRQEEGEGWWSRLSCW